MEAWLVAIALLAGMIGIFPYVSEREHPSRLWLLFGLLVLYLAIPHWKGEPNRSDD